MRKNPTLQDTEPNLALCNYVTWLYVTWLYVTWLYVTCPRALHERTLCDAFGKKTKKEKKKKRFTVLCRLGSRVCSHFLGRPKTQQLGIREPFARKACRGAEGVPPLKGKKEVGAAVYQLPLDLMLALDVSKSFWLAQTRATPSTLFSALILDNHSSQPRIVTWSLLTKFRIPHR